MLPVYIHNILRGDFGSRVPMLETAFLRPADFTDIGGIVQNVFDHGAGWNTAFCRLYPLLYKLVCQGHVSNP